MANEAISPDVLQFISAHVDSIELLSILVLLSSNASKGWTISEITNELRSSESSIQQRLQSLYQRKILVPDDDSSHRLDRSPPETKELIQKVVDQYRLTPHRIMESIYAKPNQGIKAFSDAFKLRGDKS